MVVMLIRTLAPVILGAGLLAAGCDSKDGGDPPAKTEAKTEAKAEAPAKTEAPAEAKPAAGTERGECYGNGTCNEGLECLSGLCVQPKVGAKPAEPPAAPAVDPTPAEPPPPTAEEPVLPPTPETFDEFYVGRHGLGVNRVNDGARTGRLMITRNGDHLELEGSVSKGPFDLEINGDVVPLSDKEFRLVGTIAGTPDMSWAGEAARRRETKGTFTFRSTKGRKYWRLYDVDGTECVCTDDCGNDFCYIDVGFLGSK